MTAQEFALEVALWAVGYVLFGLILKGYMTSYMAEKGKNLATKEDVRELTIRQAVARTQYELKYEACVQALAIIDAELSHRIARTGKYQVVTQPECTNHAREVDNKLILACANPEVHATYMDILSPPPDRNDYNFFVELTRFRQLVRAELGFGDEPLSTDPDRMWIARLISDSDAEPSDTRVSS